MDDLLIMEGEWPVFCKVYELVRKHKVSRPYPLPQGTNGRRGEDMGTARLLQGVDVCPEIDASRVYGVVLAMTGKDNGISVLYLSYRKRG